MLWAFRRGMEERKKKFAFNGYGKAFMERWEMFQILKGRRNLDKTGEDKSISDRWYNISKSKEAESIVIFHKQSRPDVLR